MENRTLALVTNSKHKLYSKRKKKKKNNCMDIVVKETGENTERNREERTTVVQLASYYCHKKPIGSALSAFETPTPICVTF